MKQEILRGRGLVSMTDPDGKKIPFGTSEKIIITTTKRTRKDIVREIIEGEIKLWKLLRRKI